MRRITVPSSVDRLPYYLTTIPHHHETIHFRRTTPIVNKRNDLLPEPQDLPVYPLFFTTTLKWSGMRGNDLLAQAKDRGDNSHYGIFKRVEL